MFPRLRQEKPQFIRGETPDDCEQSLCQKLRIRRIQILEDQPNLIQVEEIQRQSPQDPGDRREVLQHYQELRNCFQVQIPCGDPQFIQGS